MRKALAALAVVGGALPLAARASAPVAARASRTVGVRDEGRLRFVADNATQIIDEGHVSGTLPGTARVDFTYNGSPTVTARFVIRAAGGSLYGRATCRLSNPTSPMPSFRGALAITGGSGRYSRAHGSGELFGVFHRRGYALVVQAIGRLRD